jgi:hypothetical protein
VSGALGVAAVLLALERATYVAIARWPDAFRAMCVRPRLARIGKPVAIVERLFYAFKLLQAGVFLGWCVVHGSLLPTADTPPAVAIALVAITVGQFLNAAAFWRLGRTGAFFGDRLGYRVPWHEGFPFSFVAHPQYVGAVLTIWGVFVLLRYPHDDWFHLPVLETAYYAAGAILEGQPSTRT